MSVITADVVRSLAAFDSGGAPVTTCYLDVDGRRRVRAVDVERGLEHLVRVASERAVDGSVAEDLRRITRYVEQDFERGQARGLAVFACSDRDWLEAVPLPLPVSDRIVVGTAPAVGPLEAVVEELRPIAVLLADRQRARLFLFETGELVERTEMLDELPRHYDERGQSARGEVSPHTDELASQHLRHAAKVAFESLRDRGEARLAIAGPAESLTEVESALHPYLRERLVGRLALAVAASEADIRDAVLDLEARLEREREAELVARLRDAVGSGRRGVAGLADTLRALNERRVDRLIVSDGFAVNGWRCGECTALAAVGRRCPVCTAEMAAVDDVVAEAIHSAMAQSCRVDVCVGNADLDVAGRIGGLLRF
ncbi:MAG TPA: hypothetical protein VK866_08090 [Acidimicrobiales bacterium]|nr:hypothetical protein [Acidimicrobiales bacterium]